MPVTNFKVEDIPLSNDSSCEGDSVCEKLLKEARPSVFKVITDRGTGTGWIGPDGRLITDYHVISGATEISAQCMNGKIYKLGKNVAIDDIHDLAALDFVDSKPIFAKPLSLSIETPVADQNIALLSHRNGNPLEITQGKFLARKSPQGHGSRFFSGYEAREESILKSAPSELRSEIRQFSSRLLDRNFLGGGRGSSGGPIFDKSGKVFSVVEMGRLGDHTVFSTPAKYVEQLLDNKSQQKFLMTGTYENGITFSARRFMNDDFIHNSAHFALPAMGWYQLGSSALKTSIPRGGAIFGASFIAYQSYTDIVNLKASTNKADYMAGSAALAGDAALALGLACRTAGVFGRFGLLSLAAGAAMKLGAECIPNHYVMNKAVRTNGSASLPTIDFVGLQARSQN